MSSPDVNFPAEPGLWLSAPARFRQRIAVGMMLGVTTVSSVTAMNFVSNAVVGLTQSVPDSLDDVSDFVGEVAGEGAEAVLDAAFVGIAVANIPLGAAALVVRRRRGLASEKDVRSALRGLSVEGLVYENGRRILPKIVMHNRSQETFERLTIDVTFRSDIIGKVPAFQNATFVYGEVSPGMSDETLMMKNENGFLPTNPEFEAETAHFPLVDELACQWQARVTHPGEPFRNFAEGEVTGVEVRSISGYFRDHYIAAELSPAGRIIDLQIDGQSANYGLEQ